MNIINIAAKQLSSLVVSIWVSKELSPIAKSVLDSLKNMPVPSLFGSLTICLRHFSLVKAKFSRADILF